jgi:translation initiation factor 2 subunit 3
LKTYIEGLSTGGKEVEEVGPGGSIGILTSLDPSIVKSDQLIGCVVSYENKAPPVWHELKIKAHLLQRVVGTKKELKVEPIKLNEQLMLNVNSSATVGIVTEARKSEIRCSLKIPVCASHESRIAISRNIGNRFRLIGYCEIQESK